MCLLNNIQVKPVTQYRSSQHACVLYNIQVKPVTQYRSSQHACVLYNIQVKPVTRYRSSQHGCVVCMTFRSNQSHSTDQVSMHVSSVRSNIQVKSVIQHRVSIPCHYSPTILKNIAHFFSPRFSKFEYDTTSDWLNCMV